MREHALVVEALPGKPMRRKPRLTLEPASPDAHSAFAVPSTFSRLCTATSPEHTFSTSISSASAFTESSMAKSCGFVLP